MPTETTDKKTLRYYAVFALAAAMALSYGLLGLNYITTTDHLKKQDAKLFALALSAHKQAKTIQVQRHDTIFGNCVDQNARHRSLIDFLLDQKVTKKNNPVAYTFINKLAPLKDCYAVVRNATK